MFLHIFANVRFLHLITIRLYAEGFFPICPLRRAFYLHHQLYRNAEHLLQINFATLDNYCRLFPDLAKIQAFVHTSWRRIGDISWNRMKIIVTLHQQKNRNRFIHKDI